MKVWITKHALTQGIYSAEVIEIKDQMVVVVCIGGMNDRDLFFGEGKDWHRTEELAKKRANKMVAAKITNVNKQLEKLKKMSF